MRQGLVGLILCVFFILTFIVLSSGCIDEGETKEEPYFEIQASNITGYVPLTVEFNVDTNMNSKTDLLSTQFYYWWYSEIVDNNVRYEIPSDILKATYTFYEKGLYQIIFVARDYYGNEYKDVIEIHVDEHFPQELSFEARYIDEPISTDWFYLPPGGAFFCSTYNGETLLYLSLLNDTNEISFNLNVIPSEPMSKKKHLSVNEGGDIQSGWYRLKVSNTKRCVWIIEIELSVAWSSLDVPIPSPP